MSESEIEQAKVKLRANGDLTISEDGTAVIIAHYDKKTGILEFTTKEHSVKLYNQVVARIGSVSGGTQPSGNVIRSICVKGEKAVADKAAPKRPKLGPLGDAAEDIVQWYLDYNMPEAIIRYGIYTDERGEPIRKNVRRKLLELVDKRDDESDETRLPKAKGQSVDNGPVRMEGEFQYLDKAYIARRATALTFTPNEVVGGFQPDDDFEPAQMEATD